MSCKYNKGWDIDLEFGLNGEKVVESLLFSKKKVEVKTDRLAHQTGNVAVEFKYKGYPSGISTTESEMWAFVLYDAQVVVFIETDRLKEIARRYFRDGRVVVGGDDNNSLMVLIPIEELTKPLNQDYETGLY